MRKIVRKVGQQKENWQADVYSTEMEITKTEKGWLDVLSSQEIASYWHRVELQAC
jgi:hypothetical protein